MLVHVRLDAQVQLDSSAHFFWVPAVAVNLDCFICRRRRRTVFIEHGREEGRCLPGRWPPKRSSPTRPPPEAHPVPIRIAGFNVSSSLGDGVAGSSVRCELSCWWAPFQDPRNGQAATALPWPPWGALAYGLGCRECYATRHPDALGSPGRCALGANSVWPIVKRCPTCKRALMTAHAGPSITLTDAAADGRLTGTP